MIRSGQAGPEGEMIGESSQTQLNLVG